MKVKDKVLLKEYREKGQNSNTSNIFAFFIERALQISDVVSLIVPKSLINAPEFGETRKIMNELPLTHITDYGEKGFKGVKIETISFVINHKEHIYKTRIESYITESIYIKEQKYITDSMYPYWIIYRDEDFDIVARKMYLGVFKVFRDRTLTKSNTLSRGRIRVLKSRNIGNNAVIDIPGYDTYIDSVDNLEVGKFLNQTDCVLIPNLSYNPRACFMPKGCIADGSVAILTNTTPHTISENDLSYYATDEFNHFYSIARNRGTRSLNIDNNSVFFFGKQRNKQ